MERKDTYSEDESFRKMIETSKIIAPEKPEVSDYASD